MVNYEEALIKPFSDIKKLVIGIILSIIPIVNLTVEGFAIESSGLSKTKSSKILPEWRNWKNLFMKGLTAFVIRTIYIIPPAVIAFLGFGFTLNDIFSVLLVTIVTPSIMNQINNKVIPQGTGQILIGNWYSIKPTIIISAPLLIAGYILMFIATLITPLAVLNYVKKKSFSAAFEFGNVLKKALTGKYILAWLIVVIIDTILGIILSPIPFLGSAIVMFVMGVIGYSLYGQVYREV